MFIFINSYIFNVYYYTNTFCFLRDFLSVIVFLQYLLVCCNDLYGGIWYFCHQSFPPKHIILIPVVFSTIYFSTILVDLIILFIVTIVLDNDNSRPNDESKCNGLVNDIQFLDVLIYIFVLWFMWCVCVIFGLYDRVLNQIVPFCDLGPQPDNINEPSLYYKTHIVYFYPI